VINIRNLEERILLKEFNIYKNREFLLKRMGDISQLAGVKRYEFIDGKAKGIEAVDFKTGTGFNFTVLPGRGMDIAWTDYRGVPISYISKTGVVSPEYYESGGMNWLRNFFAGLLTTCGLCNVGSPVEEDDSVVGKRVYGLHGRISNMGADNVCVKDEWHDDDYVMSVSGRLRESMLHCENITLKRSITARMGENRLTIKDTVENEGFTEQAFMLLYHINIGYPVLDEGSRFICSPSDMEPLGEMAAANMESRNLMHAPINSIEENVYFYKLLPTDNSSSYAALVNDKLELGVYVRFNKDQLPWLTQWKMLSEAEYVLGIEPGNCIPIGRDEQKKRGSLDYIMPGEKREFEIEIGLLTDSFQIKRFEENVLIGT
jgi:hypothetical protein